MYKILCYGILLTTFSCVSPARYGKFLSEYSPDPVSPPATICPLNVSFADEEVALQSVDRTSGSFVPALVYWSWNNTLEVNLSPDRQLEYLREGMQAAADSLRLTEKLGTRQLNVRIAQAPGRFQYVNRMSVLFAVVAYSTSGVEYIMPQANDLIASYAVTDAADRQVAWGRGQVAQRLEPMQNIWKSTRGFTRRFLDDQRAELQRMGKELVVDIDRELFAVSRK